MAIVERLLNARCFMFAKRLSQMIRSNKQCLTVQFEVTDDTRGHFVLDS